MKKKKNKYWTLLVSSEANKRVFQLKIPKVLPYIVLTIFIGLSLSLFLTSHILEQTKQKRDLLVAQLSDANEEITTANNEITYYQNEAEKLDQNVERLTELEKELTTMISSINPEQITGNTGDGPIGGLEVTAEGIESNSDLNEVNKVNVEESTANETLKEQYERLNESVPNLIESFQGSIENFSVINDKLDYTPTYWPADADRITSTFGGRSDPFTSRDAIHTGIDIAGVYGTPIYAGADGKVTFAGRDGGYGNSILINHGTGLQTRYAHLSSIDVEENQQVKKGDFIGEMGSTGRSTGVHLHYEIIKNGEQINPYTYMTFMDRVLYQQ